MERVNPVSGLSDDKFKELLGKRSKADLAARAGLDGQQQELMAHLRQRHDRRYSFWNLVND